MGQFLKPNIVSSALPEETTEESITKATQKHVSAVIAAMKPGESIEIERCDPAEHELGYMFKITRNMVPDA